MAEEVKQLIALSNHISDPISKNRKKKNDKRKFDIPSREVLALTGTTYPMIPVRSLNLRVKFLFLACFKF